MKAEEKNVACSSSAFSFEDELKAHMSEYNSRKGHVQGERAQGADEERLVQSEALSFARLVIETSPKNSNSDYSAPSSPDSVVQKALKQNDKVVMMSSDLSDLRILLASNESCLVCRAALDLIESALVKTADIPLRDDAWFQVHHCPQPVHKNFCAAFNLPDWQYRNINGRPSHNFLRNLRRTVTACTMILNVADSETMKSLITEKERKNARHVVAGNPYIIYACNMGDAEIANLAGNEVFFKKLYRIRQRCGRNDDFGYLSSVMFEAQGLQEEDEDAEDMFTENIPSLREKIAKLWNEGKGVIGDWAKKIVGIFFKAVGSLFGLISAAFGRIMDVIKDFCASIIRRIFDVDSLLAYCHTKEFRDKVSASVVIFLVLTAAVIFGLDWYFTRKISDAIAAGIINYKMDRKLTTEEEFQSLFQAHRDSLYVAQNQRPDPVAAAVALGCMIWNLNGSQSVVIHKKASLVMDMMRLGTVTSCVTACVYSLMPVVMKESIAQVLETPSNRLKREAHEWCTLTNELTRLQQIPSVMASALYGEKIDEHIKEGESLVRKTNGPNFSDVRGYVTSNLVRLYQLSTVLTAMKNETRKRDEPFSIHVCGGAGVGKSLTVESLLQRAFDIDCKEIYAKNCGEDYWSGYFGQKAVIMDEFCVGAKEVRETVARQYLGIVSSAQTRLEMASLNDVRVGIKGTCFSSDYIVTINNTRYDRVDGIDDTALWRRRDLVVELELDRDNLRLDSEGNLDFSKYEPAEIYDAVWLRAMVFPREPDRNGVQRALEKNKMTFPVLCEYLKARNQRFRQRQALVKEAFGSVIDAKVDPRQIIENVFRRANGIPEHDQKPGHGFADTFFNLFTGQSEGEVFARHQHECPKCGAKRRHKLTEDGQYTCESCATVSKCCMDTEPATTDDEIVTEGIIFDGIDPPCGTVRRVKCLNFSCTKQTGIPRNKQLAEPWMCPSCLAKFQKPVNMVQINRSRLGEPIQTEKIHEDMHSWTRAVMSELGDVSVKLWSEVVIPTSEMFWQETETGRNILKKVVIPIRLLGFGVMLMGAIMLRKFRVGLGDKEEEALTFGPAPQAEAQALYDRSTRTRAKRSSLFEKRATRGVTFGAQAGVQLRTLKLKIGGANLLCCPVGGRDLLLFHHSIIDSDGEAVVGPIDMVLEDGKEIYTAVYTEDSVRSFPERDFMILRFDNKRLPSFREASRFFLSRDEVDDFDGQCLIKVDAPRKEMYSRCDVLNASYFAHGHNYEMPKMVRYQCHTINGDCGAPVLVASGPFTGKALGIHVAGTGDPFNPQGLATFVAREDLDELRLLFEDKEFCGQNMDSVANYTRLIKEGELPNLKEVKNIPRGRQLHCSSKSKLKPSLLSKVLDWEPKKAPAILSDLDPRAQGIDPIDHAVKKLGRVPANKWPVELENKGEIALEDMKVKYQRILRESGYFKHQLTLREAVEGVPGLIKAIDTSTCAGYPIGCTSRKSGKKSVIHHEGSGCVIDENFITLCDQLEEEMMNYDGTSEIDFAFQAFGKDELRSKTKLANVDTRLTYANDVIFNAVVRKRTAVLMLALCKTFGKHGMAISLNPQSFDMNKIYTYLREVDPVGTLKVIDGDFSEFDIRHTEWVIRKIFRLICDLMKDLEPNEKFWDYVIKHEIECGATVKDILYKFKSILCSGSLFTTLFNCFVNEFYFRTLFLVDYPHLSFDKEIRNVVLGDDHQVTSTSLVEWTPKSIGCSFKRFGLKYTSARKDEELKDERTPFDKSLFLGSVPQCHHGLWSGALRKETLSESLLWTRNNDKSMDAEVTQMMEAATQWDEEFYLSYVSQLREAYMRLGRKFPEPLGSWRGLGLSVANRTTDSGADFPIYRAQSEGAIEGVKSSQHIDGLTTIKTDTVVSQRPVPTVDNRQLALKSLNEREADLSFGTRSLMKRVTSTWSSTQVEGTNIQVNSVPFGLLGLGDQNNLQNMAFQNFLFSTTNVRIVFQVNGTPTQAGLAVAYFVPFINSTPDRSSKPSFQKVWLTPNQNTTTELNIDFNYWRSTLNNLNAAYFPEVMGYLRLDVYSPLVSLAATTCDITTYVSFDADFKIPRPIPVATTDGTAPLFGFSKNSNGSLNIASGTYVGQGSNVSTTNVNNSYAIGDVTGDMPIQASVDGGGKLDQTARLKAVPMDNPPVSGGALPITGQFSSMSKSNGTEVTTALQLHQQEMSYQPIHTRQPLDTNIQEICGKQGYLTKFTWNTTQVGATTLLDLNLDSCFSMLGSTSVTNNTQLPINLAVLNQFVFWRGDFVFDICAVKTAFHSGRILASVAYGDNSVNLAELNVYMNNVLDYNGDVSWQSFRVNYNNSQEYIRTWNGPGSTRARDVSLGVLKLSVLNELRATSEVVSGSVDVLVFVRFENVRVAVPKPMPIVQFSTTAVNFIAQGDNVLSGSEDAPDQGSTEVVDTTASGISLAPARPCKLTFGEKFDYTVSDVHELVRRHLPLPLYGAPTSKTAYAASTFGITMLNNVEGTRFSPTDPYDVWRIPARLNSVWNNVYAGWTGHVKFRIFVYDSKPGMVWYVPHDMSATFTATPDRLESILGGADMRVPTGVSTDVFATSLYPANIPREMTYPYTSGCSMIDVSVPYCSQYNIMPNWERRADVPDAGANWGNGYLYLRVARDARFEVFQAAGDDFRFHGFCPAPGIRGRIIGTVGSTTTTFTSGDRVGGYFV